ncbi:hypothetical protein G9A89_019477 [Geosiphon pyriformis]|nr:hypothetical protein G9A89_019477 [Geosiphon pyriformis]
MTRAKSKKAVPNICLKISNKISTKGALSVVETTRQNVLKAFFLSSNHDKLPLVATEATSSSLAGFSPVKVPSKRHTWVSSSVVSIPTKSPKSSKVCWVGGLHSGATFKVKLAHVKTVFQSVHGFLGAKSVSKDNVKLFCVEFASQQSLEAAFLVEFTSFVCLATLKIVKSLVVSESGSSSAAVALRDVPLGVFTANIKLALSVFGSVTHVVLKPVGI